MSAPWRWNVPADYAVVTHSYVVRDGEPIVYVSHRTGDDGEPVWEFFGSTEDYASGVLMLVRLDEVLARTASLSELADLPSGFCVRWVDGRWLREPV